MTKKDRYINHPNGRLAATRTLELSQTTRPANPQRRPLRKGFMCNLPRTG